MVEPLSTSPGGVLLRQNKSPSRPLLFALSLCILGFYALHYSRRGSTAPFRLDRNPHSALHFQDLFLSMSSNSTVSSYLHALTLRPHLAGTAAGDRATDYVRSHFESLGLHTRVEESHALLSYPVHSSLAAHFSNGSYVELPLAEPGVDGGVVRPYHAYSPSGKAYAAAVFVNYGREEDYRALDEMGVKVKGCVAVVRRGEVSRAAAVEKAAENGAAAVLMYTEGDTFRDGVERGTVMKGLGDPLTPGWGNGGGGGGGERLGLEDGKVLKRFPKIPSLPISVKTAESILGTLEGGRVPYEWRDTLRSKVSRVGPGPTLVNFTYQGKLEMATIKNVFAVINGFEEPDRYILLGNHRDAWTYGAVDPNSGTATLLDIARRYALLMHMGWKPRRTIILCSWDAEEFGMIGSTEWVEQNLLNLHSHAVAYLNVDCAVQGQGLFASATPQLDELLVEVTKKVKDPDSEGGATIYEKWTAMNGGIKIQRLNGVDSDFSAFLHHAGVPSADLYFGKDFPVYHTVFDSYLWMSNSGDPLFHRHVAVAGLWGLLALRLADDPILPFTYLSYVHQLQEHIDVLPNMLSSSLSLSPLTVAIQELASAAKEVEEEAKILSDEEAINESSVLKKRMLNDRLMLAERGFLDADGFQGRQWFKHLVYGPPADHAVKLTSFPGIADALSQSMKMSHPEGAQSVTQHEIWRVARAIQRVAAALRGDLA